MVEENEVPTRLVVVKVVYGGAQILKMFVPADTLQTCNTGFGCFFFALSLFSPRQLLDGFNTLD